MRPWRGGPLQRFIPADAGNRNLPHQGPVRPAVHPRGRGEQWWSMNPNYLQSGSSPRTRGTAAPLASGGRCGRFIPADAGNRLSLSRSPAAHPVHPRGRGEQQHASTATKSSPGSSPRTRGTDQDHLSGLRSRRFIPADAGNSCGYQPARCHAAVHPRGRGEQMRRDPSLGWVNGSSPRTRGTDN